MASRQTGNRKLIDLVCSPLDQQVTLKDCHLLADSYGKRACHCHWICSAQADLPKGGRRSWEIAGVVALREVQNPVRRDKVERVRLSEVVGIRGLDTHRPILERHLVWRAGAHVGKVARINVDLDDRAGP